MVKNIVKQLKDAWFIIVFASFIILWYGSTNFRLDSLEAKQEEQNVEIKKIDEIRIDIATIKGDLQYIKNAVDK